MAPDPASLYYGYVDYTTEGEPFYVGQGMRARVQTPKRKGNLKHSEIARNYGHHRRVEFVTTDREAVLDWEVATIAELHTYRYDPLAGPFACNKTLGGAGNTGLRTPEQRAAHKEAINRPGVQARRGASTKALWACPKWRAFMLARLRAGGPRRRRASPHTAEYRARMALIQQEIWSRPGMGERASALARSPEVNAKLVAARAKREAGKPPKTLTARQLRRAQAITLLTEEWVKSHGQG